MNGDEALEVGGVPTVSRDEDLRGCPHPRRIARADLLPHEEGEGLRVVVDRERGSLAEDQPAADGWRRLRLRRTLVVGEAEAFELATARLAVDYATRFE